MAEDLLAPLERWLTYAIAALEPPARRKLLREIATELRKRNQKREAAQTGPDGNKWAPRKRDRSGKVRKAVRMMEKLRTSRQMAVSANADGADVGFSGRSGDIAAIHNDGKVAEVARGGARVKYPARPLLGFNPDDIAFVRDRIMAALDP